MATGTEKEAREAVARSLKISRESYVTVPAAQVLIGVGQTNDVTALVATLDKSLQTREQAYAALLKAQLALVKGQPAEAVNLLRDGLKRGDLWLLRFTLGVAYAQAGAYAEALPELELCDRRRGETTALFLNDLPTYRFAIPLFYWLGRAQEGLGSHEAANGNYKSYLSFRPVASGDPLAKDVDARRMTTGG